MKWPLITRFQHEIELAEGRDEIRTAYLDAESRANLLQLQLEQCQGESRRGNERLLNSRMMEIATYESRLALAGQLKSEAEDQRDAVEKELAITRREYGDVIDGLRKKLRAARRRPGKKVSK